MLLSIHSLMKHRSGQNKQTRTMLKEGARTVLQIFASSISTLYLLCSHVATTAPSFSRRMVPVSRQSRFPACTICTEHISQLETNQQTTQARRHVKKKENIPDTPQAQPHPPPPASHKHNANSSWSPWYSRTHNPKSETASTSCRRRKWPKSPRRGMCASG